MKIGVLTLIIVLSILFLQNSFGQVYKRHETQLALIVKLAEQTIWPQRVVTDSFSIALFTSNQDLIIAFNVFAQKRKIHNKPVNLSTFTKPEKALTNSHLIFISDEFERFYIDVFDLIESQPILIISNAYMNKKLVMVNFLNTSDNKINFEINHANIINQGLTIDDEVLLVGGSVIDVAELYRTSQQSLRSMEKLLAKNQVVFDSLNKQILFIENSISQKNNTIAEQKALIENDKNQIQLQLHKISQQLNLIDTQTIVLNDQNSSIGKQDYALSQLQQQMNIQKKQFEQENIKFKQLNTKLDSLSNEIAINEEVLTEQSVKISRQRLVLILFVIIIALSVILLISIYLTLRINRRRNTILRSQKKEIQDINLELQSSNKELFEKNEEINSTLEKLKITQTQLLQTEKMASLGVLTAGIAHELNNPLNFVYGGVKNIIRDLQDVLPVLNKIKTLDIESDQFRQNYTEIQKMIKQLDFFIAVEAIDQSVHDVKLGSDRAIEIVRGLLNFSRVEKEEWKEMNIHESINDVLVLLQNKTKNRITIVCNYDKNIPQIPCNRDKINQAIMNLVNNAIDAIEEKGTITIQTQRIKNELVISIKDTGKGIDKETQQKIFDPFFTTKEIGEGVGLGLSITFSAIEMHKGTITVISEPGKGSEFIINLPLKQQNLIKFTNN
ncbi:MAG: YfiR/HmsC family protein [Salinivirgaceae bacterium]|jgi:signal transduction histidine kinase